MKTVAYCLGALNVVVWGFLTWAGVNELMNMQRYAPPSVADIVVIAVLPAIFLTAIPFCTFVRWLSMGHVSLLCIFALLVSVFVFSYQLAAAGL